ncbi:hypothetical protein [Enterococcus faecium]
MQVLFVRSNAANQIEVPVTRLYNNHVNWHHYVRSKNERRN